MCVHANIFKTYQLIYILMFILLIKHSSNIIKYKGCIHRIFDDIINENQHTITIFINTIYNRKCCIICKLYLMFFSRIILFYVECSKQCNSYSFSLYYYFITLCSVTRDVNTLKHYYRSMLYHTKCSTCVHL